MIKKYQVTLFCTTGAYKPISCTINNEQADQADWTLNKKQKKELQCKGIVKICNKKYWTIQDLKKYSYTRCKIRVIE